MKVLIEIKNGIIVSSYSNCKDAELMVINHDLEMDKWTGIVEFVECEWVGAKGLNLKAAAIMEEYADYVIEDFND